MRARDINCKGNRGALQLRRAIGGLVLSLAWIPFGVQAAECFPPQTHNGIGQAQYCQGIVSALLYRPDGSVVVQLNPPLPLTISICNTIDIDISSTNGFLLKPTTSLFGQSLAGAQGSVFTRRLFGVYLQPDSSGDCEIVQSANF